MIIKNGLVFTENGFEAKELYIKNGFFSTEASANHEKITEEIIDATDLYVIPGLTDIHFHGCMGQDFSNGSLEAIETIAKYQASQGITTICPATVTLPADQISQVCEVTAEYANPYGSILCGINLEGPFLSAKKKGAQNEAFLQSADLDKFQAWQKAAKGLVKLISIAPEFPENMAFIREVKDSVTVSLGHSNADYETAMKAFEAGASHVTHLFNGMSPLAHRNPGVPGAAYDCKHVMVELIGDGVHIHPAMIRTAFSIYGADRIVLISDSLEATGMSDGTYQLGGQEVTVKGNLATLGDGTLAGSVTNLMGCVRYLVKEVGISLETAIKCAAVNPTKAIGIYDKYGSLDEGKVANFVLLDKELNLKGVYIRGKQFN